MQDGFGFGWVADNLEVRVESCVKKKKFGWIDKNTGITCDRCVNEATKKKLVCRLKIVLDVFVLRAKLV